ncbi:aspartate/glutamate racemase family protein [Propioniciclava soli]|uniref:aspartate/glutamate racemase family protein n=1 Tax=Propioniciclava soli TaxID=2775081 RepID=UPI001E48CB96|nr:aspartate/glutamate racemase family protein [Propioniciclava soli]
MTTIGFLHTSQQHVETFDALVNEANPDVQTIHHVAANLLTLVRQAGAESVADEVAAELEELAAQGANVIVVTSPAIAGVAERVDVGIPVLRVDRPVAFDAVRAGRRIGVVAALASALVPTTELLQQEAKAAGVEIEIVPVIVAGAWISFEQGEEDEYARDVAKATIELAERTDIVVLAQASLMGATQYLPDDLPVLVSPRKAVAVALEKAGA